MKRRISYTLCLLFALISISSCNTMDELLAEKQDTATLTVKIAQQNPTTVTRSVTETIRNINILIFDAQGHLIGSAYADSEPTSVSVPVRVSSGCTICAIANTGSSTYFDGISTLTELKTMVTPSITSATALASKSNEILYGETPDVTLSSGTNTQSVLLKRLYSKYTFTITPNSDITITDYQLFNVPNKCYITSGHTTNPTDFTGLNYDAVTTSATAGSAVTVGPLYIYENLAGTKSASSTAELRIKDNAPSEASYFLINAKGSGWKSTYRVYLGGVTSATIPVTDYNNYDIYRNHDYQCNIAIAGSGNGDARVTYQATATRPNMYVGDATIGNYLYSDGTNGTTYISGKTVGIIFSSELTQAQYDKGYRHGKVLALKNANSGNYCLWSNANNSPYTDHTSSGHLYATTLKTSFDDVSSGYDALNANSSYVTTSTNYAWYYCRNYSDETSSKTFANSGWYLPSLGEWWDVIENLGTWTDAEKTTIKSMHTSTNELGTNIITGLSNTYFSGLNTKLTAAGGNTIVPSSGAYNFWSASEYFSSLAVAVVFYSSAVGLLRNSKTGGNYVRGVLAY